jgi:hypothetical protein
MKKILQNFGAMSGLECNYEKTNLMPIGTGLPTSVEETATKLGFSIVSEITLLGMRIDSGLQKLQENFQKIIDKIVSLVSFWERYRLSLPGRVAIAKTYLVSQLNYLGCVIFPTDDDLKRMQLLMNNFIRKNLRISDDRIQRSVELGGLGFFDLKIFLQAQQCAWINRAFKFQIDNWRYDLKRAVPTGCLLDLRKADLDCTQNPIIFNFADSYEAFLDAHAKSCGNKNNALIFENNAF